MPPPTKPELDPEEIVAAVVEVAAGLRKMKSSRVKDSTLVLLISHSSGVSQKNVRAVMDAMSSLETAYLKPRVSK